MLSTFRNLIVGTLISVLACTTGLATPNTHTATAGGKDAAAATHKMKTHKAKTHKHAGKKHHKAKKAGQKKHNTKAKKHTGKKHHKAHKAAKPAQK
ncbi:MAG TPA: hypothetical protein VMV94_01475 [Phycisphaerae bacterium]|nr:hypothetical protein [Phycisphaerae bacterium]